MLFYFSEYDTCNTYPDRQYMVIIDVYIYLVNYPNAGNTRYIECLG